MSRRHALLLAFAVALPTTALADDAEVVTLTTSDDWTLEGDYWKGAEGAPGVILLHQYHSDRTSWAPLIPELVARGFHVLALDQRAHGESTTHGEQTVRVADVGRKEFAELVRQGPRDAAAAQNLLTERGADPERLALIGASYGCSVSLLSAVALEHVVAVVLFSPGTAYFGVDVTDAMARLGGPALIFAAKDDRNAGDQAHELAGEVPDGSTFQLKVFPEGGHGTALLTARPQTVTACAEFLAEAFR